MNDARSSLGPAGRRPRETEARIGPAALVLVTVLAPLAACTSLGPPEQPTGEGPFFIAYWDSDPQGSGCPENATCLVATESEEALRAEIASQRQQKLELVDFDALSWRRAQIFVGAWQPSATEHELETGFRLRRLSRKLDERAKTGDRLVSFKVYRRGLTQRVAAIWSTGDGTSSAPARATYNRTWKEIKEMDEEMRGKKLFLAEIEVYPSPAAEDERLVAAVWRPGTVETRLETGLRCDDVDGEIVTVKTAFGDDDQRVYAHCDMVRTLYDLDEQGFQAVDIERSWSADQYEWAILFHPRGTPDWLQIGGTADRVNQRDGSLNLPTYGNPPPGDDPPAPYRLIDLEILDRPAGSFDDSPGDAIHEGLVHDGGTSGPPP